MGKIVQEIQKCRILVYDGTCGTFLHVKGLKPGECPEMRNIKRPCDVFEIAQSYIEAGTNIIGGSCETTPNHIRKMTHAVKSL